MNLNYNKMNALKFQNIREKRQECFNVDEYTFNDFDFDGKRRRVYSNVNLSIFTDDYCNANCKFCVAQLRFENKGKMYKKSKIASDDEYLSRLDDIQKKGSSPTPIRRRRKTSGVSIWMWMILWISIRADNSRRIG